MTKTPDIIKYFSKFTPVCANSIVSTQVGDRVKFEKCVSSLFDFLTQSRVLKEAISGKTNHLLYSGVILVVF